MASCDRCGGFVTPDFARVFGDNDGRVEGCLGCTPRERLYKGFAAAGRRE